VPTSEVSWSLSVLGMFLTLIGLLGSFFNLHLATWYRDVLAARTAWQIADASSNDDAKRDAASVLKGVSIWVPVLTSTAISVFIAATARMSFQIMHGPQQPSVLMGYLSDALSLFLCVYFTLTLGFLVLGYLARRKAASEAKKWEKGLKG
jgi:hypothetical protein